MKKKLIVIILLFSHVTLLAQNNLGRFVNPSWIERVIKGYNKIVLIKEFGKSIRSEAISLKDSDYNNDNSYLNLTKINLDNDIDDEYLIFIGTDFAHTMFYVIDNDFKIIHEEYLWLHNEYPQLKIYNTPDQQKMFSFKFLYGRGSGKWLFTNKIYKIDGGKVLLVSEIINDSNDTFNYEGINGHIKTTDIDEYNGSLFITYSYDLYPHQAVLQKLGISDENFSLIKKEREVIIFEYDSITKKMVHHDSDITPLMERYFFEPGNDSLFLKSFSKELHRLSIEGNEAEKKVVRYLMKTN